MAFLLDTKGPEVRTAMLRGGKDIELTKGQDVVVVAVGDDYTSWEGYKDEATGETKIGLSYAKLCQSIKPGGVILIADGAISIEVVKILNDTELLGRVINSYKLGQRKNCNLPGGYVAGSVRSLTAPLLCSMLCTTCGRKRSRVEGCVLFRPRWPNEVVLLTAWRPLGPCRRARGPARAQP